MKKLWFKSKKYGWGWQPVTWQGWLAIFAYITFVIMTFVRIDANSHSASDTLISFLPRVFLATALLIILCLVTGEKPHWDDDGK